MEGRNVGGGYLAEIAPSWETSVSGKGPGHAGGGGEEADCGAEGQGDDEGGHGSGSPGGAVALEEDVDEGIEVSFG